MSRKRKELVQQELEQIYDNHFKWLQAGKMLQDRFANSLKENPKLNLLLKLVILANIGIWSTLAIITFKMLRIS